MTSVERIPKESGPDEGIPLLAPEAEVASLRRKRELPATTGQYLMMGLAAVCGGSAVAFLLTRRLESGVGLVVFAFLLLGLGSLLRFLVRRERDHRACEAHLWPDGVELVLSNGEVRAESWDDPHLNLELYVVPRGRRKEPERLLVWKGDRKIPPVELSADGLEALTTAAKARGLKIYSYRWGRRSRETFALEIRPRLYSQGLALEAQATTF